MTLASSRREFLRRAGITAAAAGIPGALLASRAAAAPPPGARSIVCIYQRGGCDALNLLVPYEDKDYLAARPTLSMQLAGGLVDLDGDFALHPSLRGLMPFWESKQLAPIVCVGSPHPTRSHFAAQDYMEYAALAMPSMRQGWLNRYLAISAGEEKVDFRSMAMQEILPRSLRGDFPVLAVPTKMDNRRGTLTLERFERFYGKDENDGMGGTPEPAGAGAGDAMDVRPDENAAVVMSGKQTLETLKRFQEITSAGRESRVRYPETSFGGRMRSIAKVLKAGVGLEVAGIDYGGWDHHIQEGGVEGDFANKLQDLGGTVAALAEDLGPQLDDVLILVMTEFGRTVRENGNNGTDHGRGGLMLALGGGVRGGQVHGDWRGLKDGVLADGRDLSVTTDFRDVMAACLQGTFDFKPPRDFFPDYKPGKFRLFS
ncbi:MAG TPA: DUF1501 domain-containing protein [Planctomycetota bacterium]